MHVVEKLWIISSRRIWPISGARLGGDSPV